MVNPKFEEFKKNKNLRHIKDNEIVFDVDNRNLGFEAINFIGVNLYKAGYKFEIYYAEGQKSPHLHIKDIHYLDLEEEQLKKYKELFIKKYTPKEYLEFADFSLCAKHLVAEENKAHFKYKTIKRLLGVFNEDKENFADDELLEECKEIRKREVKVGSGITNKIIQKISIIDIAKRYGIEVDTKGFALCPFHLDNNPSLKFYDNQGRFCCFGCNVKGNIIDLIYLLRKNKLQEVKNVWERRKEKNSEGIS